MTPSERGEPKPLTVAQSEKRLLALVTQEGTDSTRLADDIIRAFEKFAQEPVKGLAPADEDSDGLLAEYGTYDFRGPEEFSVSLARQYIKRGDDGETWQLGATLYWEPSAETAALGEGNLWSFGMDLTDFLDQVRQLPGWAWALGDGPEADEFELGLEEV